MNSIFTPKGRPLAWTVTASLIGVFFLMGCASRPPSGTIVNESTTPYVMAPLDEAKIIPPSGDPLTLQIDQSGYTEIGGERRQVEGLTADAFRALLRRSYGPSTVIEITEFRPGRVTVLGEVFHQIHTELTDGPMRVMDAIAAANGFTPIANKRRVRLLRQNAGTITVYELDLREMMLGQDLSSNMLLKPGDVITVPRNFL